MCSISYCTTTQQLPGAARSVSSAPPMRDALTPRRRALPFRISRHVYRGAKILRTGHNTWAGLRILGYHRVSDDFDELAVPPGQFREQMLTVRAAGKIVVRLGKI